MYTSKSGTIQVKTSGPVTLTLPQAKHDDLMDALGYLGEPFVANYICSCRSNEFKVGRPKEFLEWLDGLPDVRFEQSNPDHPDMLGVLVGINPDGGGWPSFRYVEVDDDDLDQEDWEDIDFFTELSTYLAPGEIAILEEVGSEKLRYLHGQAVAVRSDGEIMAISISDIYDRVKDEWPEWKTPT